MPSAEKDATDPLDTFLRFADAVQVNAERAHRPVYAETCPCGGSVEVGRDASAAERRRIYVTFIGRHRDCLTRVTPPVSYGEGGSDAKPITNVLSPR